MNIINKVRHVFPYLYYRCYDLIYKQDENCNAELRAWGFVTVIKSILIFSFICLPICVHWDSSILFFLPSCICLILLLNKKTRKKYHEMMSLWKNEPDSQRRTNGFFLIVFCLFAMFSYVPVILLL